MRYAIISDIHGNIDALEAVLADIERRGVKDIINLGDCLSGPLDAMAVADRLMPLNLPTLRGNHDRQLIDRPAASMGNWERWVIGALRPEHLEWIKTFPLTVTIGDVFCCHAAPEKDDKNWLDSRGPMQRLVARNRNDVEALAGDILSPVMLCGHTHTPRVVRLTDGRLVVNPGAVGCPAYLDTRIEPHFIHETGAPDARYAIVEKVGDGWSASLMSVPYDASAMAAMARAKGEETWARAVETGWIT